MEGKLALDEVLDIQDKIMKKHSLVVEDLEILTQPRFVDILDWFIRSTLNGGVYEVNGEKISRITLKGGRGSVKSSLNALMLVLGVYLTQESGVVIMKTKTSISQAAYAEIMHVIRFLGLEEYFYCPKSELKIYLKGTNAVIIFEGCYPDIDRLKSIKSPTGYFKFVWMEEANMIASFNDFVTAIASVIRGNDIKTLADAVAVYNGEIKQNEISPIVFISYNPHEEDQHWSYGTLDIQQQGQILRHANYTTVNKEWLSDAFLNEVRYLLATPTKAAKRIYLNKYLGLQVQNERTIFDNIVCLDSAKEFTPLSNGKLYYGMDFSNGGKDPYAFVVVRVDMQERILQILYSKFSKTGKETMTAVDFVHLVKGELIDFFPREQIVWCDNSPELNYLYLNDFDNFLKARKQGLTKDEKDSMRVNGYELLSLMRRIEIPREQEEILEEFRQKKRVIKNGVVYRTPEDGLDHGIDAVRYAIWELVYDYIAGINNNKMEVNYYEYKD